MALWTKISIQWRSNVKRSVFNFFRKIVTDFASRISRGNLFHKRGAQVRQPRAMNGRNFFLTAVQDVITSYFRISVFAGVSRNVIHH